MVLEKDGRFRVGSAAGDFTTAIDIDVSSGIITAGDLRFHATLPSAMRDAFVSGQWNPTAMLLERFDEVRAVAERLPYLNGF